MVRRESLARQSLHPVLGPFELQWLKTLKKATAPPIFEVIFMHFLSDSGFTEHLTTWALPQNRDKHYNSFNSGEQSAVAGTLGEKQRILYLPTFEGGSTLDTCPKQNTLSLEKWGFTPRARTEYAELLPSVPRGCVGRFLCPQSREMIGSCFWHFWPISYARSIFGRV